jgi:phosphomevalonate kinase
MNALAPANELLAAAKSAIDSGDHQLAAEYIEAAKTGIQSFRRESKIEAVIEHGREALEELDHLEQVRRLVVYGLSQGRGGSEAIKFSKIMATRPPIKTARGLGGLTPAFEWLKSNRRQLSNLIQTIAPSES